MTITETNVPNHMSNPTDLAPNPNPIKGKCEIFIVSYWKDFPWLEYCIKSIKKFCGGFSGVTIAVPWRDVNQAHDVAHYTVLDGIKIRIEPYREVEGKGMVQHMEIMSRADEFVPAGTDYVLHHDSDGIFNVPTTPEDFFRNDKPVYLYRTWESLTDPVSKVVSDCAQWREPTDKQLGFASKVYTMAVNTQMMPIEFYRKYRSHLIFTHSTDYYIETANGAGNLLYYFLAGKNDFPQDRMDFTAMGAFAYEYMREWFSWFDVASGAPHPRDPKRAYWSHGGIAPEIRAEIEGILSA
jgi:hypothetical protein